MKDREVSVELSGTQSLLNPLYTVACVFQLKNLPGTAVQTYVHGLEHASIVKTASPFTPILKSIFATISGNLSPSPKLISFSNVIESF
jgi:hypothetical protein